MMSRLFAFLFFFTLVPGARADAPLGGAANGMIQFVPFVAIFVLMYFLILRPNQKREKERRAMVSALKRGDRIVTGAGIVGVVHKVVNDEEILFEIAENVRVRLLRTAVVQVLAKGTSSLAQASSSEQDDAAETLDASEDAPATPKKSNNSGKKSTPQVVSARRAKKTSE